MNIEHLAIPVSWAIAAEYLRLADTDLMLRETHAGGGLYDSLDVVPAPGSTTPVLQGEHVTAAMTINRGGSIHLAGGTTHPPEQWVRVRDRDELREYVTDLLLTSGVGARPRARKTDRRLLGYRLIASVTAARALTGNPWDARAAFYDSSGPGGSHVVPGVDRGFPGVGAAPSHDVWLLGPGDLTKSTRIRLHDGYAVNEHDEVLDLHHRYRNKGADLENLTGQLLAFL